jgi:diguanylate cyclase (GGDEF)-like protein
LQLADQLRSAISRARQRGQSVTLFYIDLDGFKPINEDFGHDVGDKLLIAVGERLAASTRANDMVARLGGDEFAVLIDAQSTPEDAEVVAARLFEAFDESFEIEGNDLRLGASIGRAVYPTDADSADGLLRCADAAMFGVKRGRRETRGDGVAAQR